MKIILGLAGDMASGKGTIANYLIEEKKGSGYKFSHLLRGLLNKLDLEENRDNLQRISEAVRDCFGDKILCKAIRREVERDYNNIIVIDGVRRKKDIEELSRLEEFKLIFIEADLEKRYNRIKEKNENKDDKDKTFEEFKKDHLREAETEIKDLRQIADYIVDNNGTFSDLYRQVDNIIEECER